MINWNEKLRFYLPVAAMGLIGCALVPRMAMLHFNLLAKPPKPPRYVASVPIPGVRGSVYFANGATYPAACTIPIWEYHVDGMGLNPKHNREKVVATVAEALGLPKATVREAYWAAFETKKSARFPHGGSRYVPLEISYEKASDPEVHARLADRTKVSGLNVEETSVRRYPQGRTAAAVIGYVSHDPQFSVGAAGVEQRYEQYLKPIPGRREYERDARGREIPGRRTVQIDAKDGADVYLTIDQNVQFELERALKDGLVEFRAQAAWAIVMQAGTGAILGMVSLPDYDPQNYNRFSDAVRRNRAIGENYEPGSVMKTITACALLDAGIVGPDTLVNTDRHESGYYKLPGDGSHRWKPMMSVEEALVHSSNIVYGKLGVRLGPQRLWTYMKAFGLGRPTGVDLPGEERGIFPDWRKWDKASQSRAPIGQYVAVTPIQLVTAYAAIANDGVRMKPYVVSKVVSRAGETLYRREPERVERVIRADTARRVRAMMRGVARKGGTARRAAVKGYTVAGKTGTAQMKAGKGYSQTDYNASFIGMIPSEKPSVVILVTFQRPEHNRRTFSHQGGVCAGPVFSRIATALASYLAIEPDVPEELPEDDAFWTMAENAADDVIEEEGGTWEE